MPILSGKDQLVNIQFTVFDIDGVTVVTGLGDGAFTKVLLHEATVSALAVVISEVAAGEYVASLTPNIVGDWWLRIVTPADANLGYVVQVSEDDIGVASTMTRKYMTNAQEVNLGTQELIIRDDDGTTPYQTHDLTTDGGEPVTTHPGIQIVRSGPKL
jgi:hypothetical protein